MKRKPERKKIAISCLNFRKARQALFLVGFIGLIMTTIFVVNTGLEKLQLEDRLALERVRIEGKLKNLDREDIQKVVRLELAGSNYFTVDLDALKASLEGMEWMQSASIARVWPTTLDIRIQEKVPVAIWNKEFVISNEGEIFNPGVLPEASEMPSLDGPNNESKKIMAQYLTMSRLFRSLDMEIISLHFEERQSWKVIMENGLILKVDDHRSLEKVTGFIGIYDQYLRGDLSNISSIDLRYENGIAVKWKETQAVAAL